MGLFTNYGKKINEIETERKERYKIYNEHSNKLKNELNRVISMYADQVAVINSERANMYYCMTKLQDFLKNFGYVNEITPFEYVTESSFISRDSQGSIGFMASGEKSVNAAEIAVLIGAQILGGLILSAPVALFYNNKSKKEYIECTKKLEDEKLQYDQYLKKIKIMTKQIKDAIEIASIYRSTIMFLRDFISKKILPEMDGIMSFLYADAINERLRCGENLKHLSTSNIVEFTNTRYNGHVIFVKNTLNCYKEITEIFTTPFLTHIIEDISNEKYITKSEKNKYIATFENVKSETKLLESSAMFYKEARI